MHTGISLETAASIEKTKLVIDNTVRLMRSDDLSEYFSETFIEKWEKRRRFWIGDALAKRLKHHHKEVFEEIDKLYENRTPLDRIVRKVCSSLILLESSTIFTYFTLKNFHGAFFNVFMNRLLFIVKTRLKRLFDSEVERPYV